jgi:Putative zinc-finger
MRCTHAEKLIPLFAGDDLPAREADALRRHLRSCANCRRLAAEFEESRDWLRLLAAPQFDEATLEGMRDSVLRDIGRIENRALWLQWIVPGWNLRFAASMTMLLLIVFVATYAHRGGRPRIAPGKDDVVKTNPGSDQKDSTDGAQRNSEGFKVNPSAVPAQRLPLTRIPRINRNPGVKPVQLPDLAIANAPVVPPAINIGSVFEPPPGADMATDDAIFNREMTRIEFQTADPNIRIIWLAPKDSDSSSTKSNTNTR